MSHRPAPKFAPSHEMRRLRALRAYGILDTPREAAFDDIVRLAAAICDTPISLVSFVEDDRQWFKAEEGMGVSETPMDMSMCAHAILEHDVLVIPDTRVDERVCGNPLVTGHQALRFYAGALLKTPDGLPLGTVCVLDTRPRELTDIQVDALRRLARQVMAQLELRRIATEAQERETRLGALVAAAGHDLKSPLRTASYAMDRLSRNVDEDTAKRLGTGRQALCSIDRQLTQLLAVASTGAYVTSDATSRLQDAFDALESIWRAEALRRGVTLRFAATPLVIQGPSPLLETLLGNLVSNALKYTPQGGEVDVHAEIAGHAVRVSVRDTGIGISADKQDAIFDAFQQVDPCAEGLGLGLWIVCQVAASLGGRVQVSSTEGEGSTFWVDFPTQVDEIDQEPQMAPAIVSSSRS